MGNLRLIRRVSGVPRRVFQEIAQDRRWREARMVALADVLAEQLVLASDLLQVGQGLGFALPHGQRQHAGAADGIRHNAGDQLVQTVVADDLEHDLGRPLVRPDMTPHELTAGVELYFIAHKHCHSCWRR
ncbi:hypothetical protein D3C81_1406780 [compost metagenome]